MNKYLEKIAALTRSLPNAYRRASQVLGGAINRTERKGLDKVKAKELLHTKGKKAEDTINKAQKADGISKDVSNSSLEQLSLTRSHKKAFDYVRKLDL